MVTLEVADVYTSDPPNVSEVFLIGKHRVPNLTTPAGFADGVTGQWVSAPPVAERFWTHISMGGQGITDEFVVESVILLSEKTGASGIVVQGPIVHGTREDGTPVFEWCIRLVKVEPSWADMVGEP